MAAQNFLTQKSFFIFVDRRVLSEFVCRTMFEYGRSFCVFVSTFMLNVFWHMVKCTERLKAGNKSQGNGANFNVNHSQRDDQAVSASSADFESDLSAEKESSEFSFSFLIQGSKDSGGKVAATKDSGFLQSGYIASTSKYQFMPGKNVCGFKEEPESMRFTVQEMFVGSVDDFTGNCQSLDREVSVNEYAIKSQSEEKVQEFDRCSNSEEECPDQEIAENLVKTLGVGDKEILEITGEANSTEEKITADEETNGLENYYLENDDISYELQLLPMKEFSAFHLKPELEIFDDELHAKNHEVQSGQFQFSFDEMVKEILATDAGRPEFIERNPSAEEVSNNNSCVNREANANENSTEAFHDQYIELDPCSNDSSDVDKESLSQKNENLHELEWSRGKEMNLMNDRSQTFEDVSLEKESWQSDSDDEDEFDTLWEHQQLVKQMKMEMRNSKVRGLPTISEEEECETPKIVHDLKPLRIEEKFEYKDRMAEIHKFYKSYAEKMRKLDVLNYQTLHGISFLQLKDSQLFIPSKKASVSSIKNLSLPSFWLCKQRRIYADPTVKSITEMHRDLELVYVGQLCLSWEFLRWQYGKVIQLLEYDFQGHHSYNQIAGEYQQFQVLVQRFLEDEPFQGPRLQNYVKSRCFCRSLLQVPVIKDDYFKDKKERIEEQNGAISLAKLVETIRESMQVFWEFLRAEKHETYAILKGVQESLVHLQTPADSELLMNIRTCLDKKERKLKDILRSGNCIVKKFQKHQAAGRQSYALFITQVELKLVSRVLSLSKLTTDQLIWCEKKLNNINIVNRRIQFEHAFLLFPC